MRYDTSNIEEELKCRNRFNHLINNKRVIELKEPKNTRTSRQNSALHLFFTFVSDELNNMGMEFTYQGLTTPEISMMHTPELVKNFIWRPIQIALFDIESTKDLNTGQMNKIIDVITKFMSDRGVQIEFPSIETLID